MSIPSVPKKAVSRRCSYHVAHESGVGARPRAPHFRRGALIDPASKQIVPLPRPVSLKNASIEAIRRFAPEAVLGPTVRDTLKGAVAHVKPPADSVRRAAETATRRWVAQPRYEAGAPARAAPVLRGQAFMQLADSAFNYSLHRSCGFRSWPYGDLDEAIAVFAKPACPLPHGTT